MDLLNEFISEKENISETAQLRVMRTKPLSFLFIVSVMMGKSWTILVQ